MSEKQPKLRFEEEKERTATRSPPKKSKVEQSMSKKQKLKQDADKAAEKSQHLRFGKAEITPDEASRMTKQQIFFKITLLQMIKRVVPPMSNEIITLVKDTSLARIIAAYELTFAGAAFMKSDGLTWPLFYTGVFYLVFVGILTLLFNYIEKKLDYFR